MGCFFGVISFFGVFLWGHQPLWSPLMGTGNGYENDTGNGYGEWMRGMDTGNGCGEWIPGMDAGNGCGEWMRGMDAEYWDVELENVKKPT